MKLLLPHSQACCSMNEDTRNFFVFLAFVRCVAANITTESLFVCVRKRNRKTLDANFV
jgi:hypothetical protein